MARILMAWDVPHIDITLAQFLDLADIPRVLPGGLPRTRFGSLGLEGGWFEPRKGPPDLVPRDDNDEPTASSGEPTD